MAILTQEAVKDLFEGLFRRGVSEQLGEATGQGVPRALAQASEAEGAKIAATGYPTGVRGRGAGVPFPGTPEVAQAMRSSRQIEQIPAREWGRGIRNFVGGFFDIAPGTPGRFKEWFRDARLRHSIAEVDAVEMLKTALDPIQDNHYYKYTKLSDFMRTADALAQVRREIELGKRDPDLPVTWTGASMGDLQDTFGALAGELQHMPDVMEAHKNVRAVLDDVFADMAERDYIHPDRYLEDYLPTEKLQLIGEGLNQMRGENKFGGRVLPAMLQRGANNMIGETDLVSVMHDYLADYYRKTAEDSFITKVLDDPNLNLTRFFNAGDALPRGIVALKTGPGMPGYGIKRPEMHFLEGAQAGIAGITGGVEKGTYRGMGAVMPEEIADAIMSFKPMQPDSTAAKFYHAGQSWSRLMTVYNPRNTALNVVSDLLLALLGEPGEKARPLGILRFEPAAVRIAFKAVFKKEREFINPGGAYNRAVDAYGLAKAAGLGQSTLISDIGGLPIDEDLAKFAETLTPNPLENVRRFMAKTRQAVELSPRIAAGLEALARTGSLEEFGRVGRDITLPYGYGAPAHARVPFVRFLTPFIQFVGLATKRVFDLTTTPGSRTRGVLALSAVPTAVWMWNTQNDEFRKAEASLKPFERDQMHVILSDPDNPAKPAKDEKGEYRILRTRFWVPEEVMRTFGLGNLPSRISRVAQGRETISEVARESQASLRENVAFQLGPVGAAQELLTGRSLLTGEEKKSPFNEPGVARKVASAAEYTGTPQGRGIAQVIRAAQGGSLEDIFRSAVEQTVGISYSRTESGVGRASDADLKDMARKIRELAQEATYAGKRGDMEGRKALLEQRRTLILRRRELAARLVNDSRNP